MYIDIPIHFFPLNLFPAQLFRDVEFTNQFCCSIRALKNQWLHFEQLRESQAKTQIYPLNQMHFEDKLELLKKMADKTFFISQKIILTKKCPGHDIRINSRKIRKKKVEHYIEMMMKKFTPDKYALQKSLTIYKASIPRRPRRFDIRAFFKHPPNSLNCDAKTTKEVTTQKIEVSRVLEQFEEEVVFHNLNLQEQYETLLLSLFS